MDSEEIIDVVDEAIPGLTLSPVVVGVALVAVGALGMRWWMKKTQKNLVIAVKDEDSSTDQ